MSGPGFRFDEVGDWSVLKLDIIEQYGSAYTNAFNVRGRHLKKYYIDGFSGAGVHVVKSTRQQIEGSPARAQDHAAVRWVLFHRPQQGQNCVS